MSIDLDELERLAKAATPEVPQVDLPAFETLYRQREMETQTQ
jgi:hypothetical protein